MSEPTVGLPKHLQTGRDGERFAIGALESRGFKLVESNWHCSAGELDAIMRDGDELVFVEVKTRTGNRSGSAEEALTWAKSAKLAIAAEWYLSEHLELSDLIWRIDLVALTLDSQGRLVRFSHITNAALVE